MGTATSFDSADTVLWQGFIANQEFLVFSGKDVVSDSGWISATGHADYWPSAAVRCRSQIEQAVFHVTQKNTRTNVVVVPQSSAECQ